MLQLLLVDDESSVVDTLAVTLPWNELGFTEVYKAYSGAEALQLIDKHPISVVITDIRMPGMSGLQLIEHIRERTRHTKCLLLTGHSDFEYAQQAIRMSADAYLLKPVSDEELIREVSRAAEAYRQEWAEIASRQKATDTLRTHLPHLRSRLLSDLLQGRRFSEGAMQQQLDSLNIPIQLHKPTAVMMVRLEEEFADYDYNSLSLMEYAVSNIAEEVFESRCKLWHCKDAYDYLVYVLQAEDVSPLDHIAALLQENVKQYLKGRISIVISRWGTFPTDIVDLYQSTLASIRRTIGTDKELFVSLSGQPDKKSVHALERLYEPPTILHLLEAGRWDAAEEKLDAIFRELETRWPDSQEHAMEVYSHISSSLSHIAHKNGSLLADVLGADYGKWLEREPFRSLHQLKEWMRSALSAMRDSSAKEIRDSRSNVVHAVNAYIETNLQNDVSLQAIADHVHLHPVYLSKVYKLETGENLSDYMLRTRMEKAAFLLKSSGDKIYEVAAKLGYQNTPYFIKVFKKHFGLTPQEYRDG